VYSEPHASKVKPHFPSSASSPFLSVFLEFASAYRYCTIFYERLFASKTTYIVSGGASNSTHSLTSMNGLRRSKVGYFKEGRRPLWRDDKHEIWLVDSR